MRIDGISINTARHSLSRSLFDSLYYDTHPLRIALSNLQTLDTVSIIEGKEK
jgi:hypothetical protein